MDEAPGTQGYAAEADALVRQYEALPFETVHAPVRHLLPPAPARALDVGAGTGRDAAGLAAMGHAVVAVEPVGALRTRAMALHPGPGIEWVDDHLPDLVRLRGREGSFDLVMLTAVWMHLDEAERRRAMPRVAALVRPGGVVTMSLRHGPVPPGRRMFEVPAAEAIALAGSAGLGCVLEQRRGDGLLRRADVAWDLLAFRRDGAARASGLPAGFPPHPRA